MADSQYRGPLENCTHCGAAGVPGEGPYMQIWLEVSEVRDVGEVKIRRAAYRCNGCPSSMAAGSMAARLVTGISLEKAKLITGEDLLRILGGLPEGREECAHRAISAVHKALAG